MRNIQAELTPDEKLILTVDLKRAYGLSRRGEKHGKGMVEIANSFGFMPVVQGSEYRDEQFSLWVGRPTETPPRDEVNRLLREALKRVISDHDEELIATVLEGMLGNYRPLRLYLADHPEPRNETPEQAYVRSVKKWTARAQKRRLLAAANRQSLQRRPRE